MIIAAILSGILSMAGTAYAAQVNMTFAGVPGNGRFNSGALSESDIGTQHATAKLYYLTGSSIGMISTGILVQGQGFEGYGKVGFSLAQGTSDAWANSSLPPDPEVAPDGTFLATASFRRLSSAPYGASERLVICLRINNTGELIPGTAIVLDLIPTPISLPVTLDAVTLYTEADYEGDHGVVAQIVAPDGKQFGVANAALSDGSRTISLDGGDVWSPTNGVTAAKNVDSSAIIFRTAAQGATEVKPAEKLTISGTGIQVVNDGVAAVYGIRRGQTIEVASFSLEVLDGGHLIPGVSGPLSFQVGADASSTPPVTITATPSNLAVSGFLITDPDGSNPASSKTLGGGLVITVDPDTGKVSFSGKPSEEVAETAYKITAKTPDGRTLTTEPDLKVSIAPGEVYTASFSPSSFGGDYNAHDPFWTAGHDIGTVSSKVTIKDSEGNDASDIPVTFTLVDKDGNVVSSPWNGLAITVDDATKTMTLSGTPTKAIDPDTDGIYVKITPQYGQVSPNPVPVKIQVDPDVDYVLTTGTSMLTAPVGESFETNIDLFTSPAYPKDMIPRALYISDGTTSNPATFTWNGLTITAEENVVTNKCWLRVSGEAIEAGKKQFTVHPTRGTNMADVTFTIAAEVPLSPEEPLEPEEPDVPDVPEEPEPPEPQPDEPDDPEPEPQPDVPDDPEPPDVPQPLPDQPEEPVIEPHNPVLVISKPVVVAVGDDGPKEVDEPAAGQPTQIVYNVSVDVNIDIQGVNVQLPDGKTVKASPLTDDNLHDPYNVGGGGGNVDDKFAYYYDKNHQQIVVYATPAQAATYIYNIYYHGPNKQELKKQPVVVHVVEVNNYYTRKKSGGGCSAGMTGFALLGAMLLFASRLNRKDRPKK
ncbi:MAG: hypothetical protein LBP21_09830 [Synergistaceae bacterium]|nr:hypothetical protein [Synergistaceae bacterium]